MAPVVKKTYQYKTRKKRPWADICKVCGHNEGEDRKTTFDALFSHNIKQQKKNLKAKKSGKAKYSVPVPKKSPILFRSTDDEGAFESTFDRILREPVLQDPEPLNVDKNSDFGSSSSGMRSSSSDPSYNDLSLFPVKKKNTKSRVEREPPVLRRSRATPKVVNKGENKDSCLTSTPMAKKCENKLSVALSPVKRTQINVSSNRILTENSSFISSRTRKNVKKPIGTSKTAHRGCSLCASPVCDRNNKHPKRKSDENEMFECISSMDNLHIETSCNKSLFKEVHAASKTSAKSQIEHNVSMMKQSNGNISNEVQTSLNIDTLNNVQKISEAAPRQNSISPIMFDSWNTDPSAESSSNQLLVDSSVKLSKTSFNRLPCRRHSLMVVPSDVMISRFKLPSFSDVYRKTFHQNRTTVLETSFAKSETEEDGRGDERISLSESLLAGTSTVFTARDAILQRCNQEDPVSFSEAFATSYWKTCRKIGEGVYGEVFMSDGEDKSVLKIIPIEGSELVNGEPQKKFEEILSEIVIAMELSNLRNGEENSTCCFSEMKRCLCVKGKYPDCLIQLWNDYDELKGSENDSPEMFHEDQLYIILELANGGSDLESYEFCSAEQSLSILVQIACALAVAERELQFEHRDLHWGNVLISRTTEMNVVFRLDRNDYVLRTKGVKATIIDFTLSRMTYDGCCIFNDLSKDPSLFTAEGDYQFEIYRLMKKHTKNQWNTFVPHTNILWLHYLIDKIISMVNYQKKTTKAHRNALGTLEQIKDMVLFHKSTPELVLTYNLHEI